MIYCHLYGSKNRRARLTSRLGPCGVRGLGQESYPEGSSSRLEGGEVTDAS